MKGNPRSVGDPAGSSPFVRQSISSYRLAQNTNIVRLDQVKPSSITPLKQEPQHKARLRTFAAADCTRRSRICSFIITQYGCLKW